MNSNAFESIEWIRMNHELNLTESIERIQMKQINWVLSIEFGTNRINYIQVNKFELKRITESFEWIKSIEFEQMNSNEYEYNQTIK